MGGWGGVAACLWGALWPAVVSGCQDCEALAYLSTTDSWSEKSLHPLQGVHGYPPPLSLAGVGVTQGFLQWLKCPAWCGLPSLGLALCLVPWSS